MFFLKTQHLSDFAIAQGRLKLTHLASNRCIGTHLLQVLFSGHSGSDSVVSSIEDLKAQAILLDTQVADLAQITGINVGPRISFSGFWFANDVGKVSLVLVGFNHISDSQNVDIAVVEAAGERSCGLFAADLGQGVCVHGIDIVVFLQRERVVIGIALGKADSIGGFRAGDDDFGDAEFAGCFDDIVGCGYVASEAFVVWDEHVAGVGCKVDDYIWRLRDLVVIISSEVVMRRESVVDLAAVGEVGLEGEDVVVGSGKVDQVKIEDLVALLDKLRYGMTASLA